MKNRKGFTLIELLIVIAIIGILAVAFVPSIMGAPAKGRDAQRIAMLGKINDFMMLQYAEGKSLPATIADDYDSMCMTPDGTNPISVFIKDNIESFGGVFPADPQPDNYALTIDDTPQCQGGYVFHHPPQDNLPPGIMYALGAGVELEENANSEENHWAPGGDGENSEDFVPFYLIYSGK